MGTLVSETPVHQLTGNQGNKWKVTFEYLPKYSPNGDYYYYEIREDTSGISDNYSDSCDVKTNESTVYEFTNTYPKTADHGELTKVNVEKEWNGDSDSIYLERRPDKVEVELYCRYGNSNTSDYYDGPARLDTRKNGVSSVIKDINGDDSYQYIRYINKDDDWSIEFENLPLNINPKGGSVDNGQSYIVDYYVVETHIKSYSTKYSSSENEGIKTLKVTNTLGYYFNIEKNIPAADPNQTFIFKVEYYETKQDMLNNINIKSVSYSTIKLSDNTTGRNTIYVLEDGWYKISEVSDWSKTDYDYKSDNYLYGLENAKAESYVIKDDYIAFCIQDVYGSTLSIDNFPTAKFINDDSPYAYRSDQDYKENIITFN